MSPRWNSQCASARPCRRARARRNAGADRSTPTAWVAWAPSISSRRPAPVPISSSSPKATGPEFFVQHGRQPGLVPVRGRASAELAGRRLFPVPDHDRHADPITLQCGILRVDGGQQFIEPVGPRPAGRGPVIDPLLLPEPVQEACLGKQPQVAGDPGLALPHHPADFPHRELTVAQKRHQAQPGGFGQVLEHPAQPGRPWSGADIIIQI